MPRLGDAVQRWLRHPEPFSSSLKSAINAKIFTILYGGSKPPPYSRTQVPSAAKRKNQMIYSVSVHIRFTPAHLFLAGVQTMRARICSASSCAMFARVVWMKLWGVAKLPIFTLSFASHTRHAWLARLTRARRTEVRKEDGASPPC